MTVFSTELFLTLLISAFSISLAVTHVIVVVAAFQAT